MTMHLDLRLTTTSTKKRETKLTKAKLIEFEGRWKERNKMLKSMGLPKETFDEFLAFIHGKPINKKVSAKVEPLSSSYSLKVPDNRRTNSDIYFNVSKETKIVGPDACAKRSIMDPRVLANEKPEVREAILAKSHRLMPLYNKGGYQYVTDGEDVTTLGTRSRRS
jgi:hypothetical protein